MIDRRAARELAASPAGAQRRLAGRVVAHAEGSFTLQDDTGFADVSWARGAVLGAFVIVDGQWNGRSVAATRVEAVSAKSEHFTRAQSDFTQLMGKRLSNLRARHALLRAIREFCDDAGLLEVDTPAIVPCPGLDVHLDAIEVLGMGAPRWLHTSPEYQMKRLLVTGLPGVYQLGKAFRRGERGKLHEPEFTMLEWYRSFAGWNELMQDTERLVVQVTRKLLGSSRLPGLSHEVDLTPPWERLRVDEAFERYAGVSLDAVLPDEERFYRLLIEKIEPELGRGRPTFLTHYPASMASLARLCPHDPRFAERFEAYLDGVELCNGFSELTDPAEQRKRLQADQALRHKLGRSVYPIDERFLSTLEDGIPPSGGNALGVDRLLMLLTHTTQIDEVVAFSASRL